MRSRNEMRKPVREMGSDESKKIRKLKPVPKQKNIKQSLFKEIDDLEDIDMSFQDDSNYQDYNDNEHDEEDE